MIKKIEADEIPRISNYIWDVYQDEKKRTTPPYQDAEDIETHLLKRIQYEDNHFLGVYINDNLEGAVIISAEENEHSIFVQGPYIYKLSKYNEVAFEIMNYIESKFKGLKCYFGTTKTNVLSQEFLKAHDFLCTDDTIQMSVSKDTFIPIETSFDIQLLTKERMEAYKEFHDVQYQDYYWLSDRIYEVLDQWKIHVALENNKIIGSVFTMKQSEDSGEVYGCKVLDAYKSKQPLAELLYHSTKSWLDEGLTELVNFVPEGIDSEAAADRKSVV